MYHQTGHTGIAELGRQIEGMIPTATFPKQLGFVALPYSQGTGFFANLLLYHELGHFVLEELSSSSQALIELDARLAAETDDAFKNRASSAGVRAFALQVIRSWTHGVFCDLFALHLIGPAFSFAFVDLLNLLDILEAPTTISFNESHPAPACRFREHLQALKTLGWWSLLDDVKAPQKTTIERLAAHGNDDYRLDLHGDLVKDELLVPAFLRVLPEISISARALTSTISVPAEEFGLYRTHIETCLLYGVVPSVPSTNAKVPSPVYVMNACFTFYLTSLERLIEALGKSPHNIEERSKWTQRLEGWTQKAVEDIQLLNRRKGGSARGGSFETRNSKTNASSD